MTNDLNPWREYAEHLEHCVTCAEDGVNACYEGRPLKEAASTPTAPPDRATEWGEYMAKGAEALLNALHAEDEARVAFEEKATGEGDMAYQRATEARCEFVVGLRSDIHEFRKRVEQDRDAMGRLVVEASVLDAREQGAPCKKCDSPNICGRLGCAAASREEAPAPQQSASTRGADQQLYRKVEVIRDYAYHPTTGPGGGEYTYWQPKDHPGEEPPPGWFRIDYETVFEPFAAPASSPLAETGEVEALRAEGWSVAVHNDYKLQGVPHTFWLFTNGGRAIKGEGQSDAEALAQVRAALTAAQPADGKGEGA